MAWQLLPNTKNTGKRPLARKRTLQRALFRFGVGRVPKQILLQMALYLLFSLHRLNEVLSEKKVTSKR